jgi:hypothetical protein
MEFPCGVGDRTKTVLKQHLNGSTRKLAAQVQISTDHRKKPRGKTPFGENSFLKIKKKNIHLQHQITITNKNNPAK